MKKALQRPFYLIILLLAGVATGAAATCNPGSLPDDQHCMTLVDAGAGYVMGGVYTSPYGVTVDGVRELLICDDFRFDIPYLQYTWTAIETSLTDLRNAYAAGTSVSSNTPKFYPGVTVTQAMLSNYATAAVLAGWLMSEAAFNSKKAGELSYAIWAVFDTYGLLSSTNTGHGTLTNDELYWANKYLADARQIANAAVAQQDFSLIPELTIYTPTGARNSQEFIKVSISMPEPSAIALLAVDLMGIVGLVLFVRRRRARAVN